MTIAHDDDKSSPGAHVDTRTPPLADGLLRAGVVPLNGVRHLRYFERWQLRECTALELVSTKRRHMHEQVELRFQSFAVHSSVVRESQI